MCFFVHVFILSEPRTGREEGDGGSTPGEHEEQRGIKEQGPGGCAPVEGKVQETAEGTGGGELPGSISHRQGLAGQFRQTHSLHDF